ncbi:short-chain dehydrogenase [Streptomyces viridochromogenes]|uniref:Short-chain dehydrogenase n=1 Tax=Streptomyces viridochromogenes TaxID=1938 RepID=A0A0J7ZMS6_STRVR|nr:SDR family oxidoreductase [Streptomyces viridochromogenes]KMS77336.1 short-chain dehydrogenase [Streptomyces viridochromogenes]KOG19059.1 short-chain dehydrogenase [Streptomyces viridochromogenes]KOG19298.1 short-chain dehydrogenase [Streptomyces viridochromogenes]
MSGQGDPVAGSTLGLEGRIALITGGTRGLGLAIARKLCACGGDVVLNYGHSDEDAERATRSLAGLKGTATAVRADLADPRAVPQLLEKVRARYGRLDVFVHNAAGWTPMQALHADLGALREDTAAALHPLLAAAPLLPGLMRGGRGRVVAVSSTGAHRVVPGYVSLGVAKAALESLVRYLAVDLSPHGIAVNAVSTAKLDKGTTTVNREASAALAQRTPAGRLTTPADVADVVALLCTDEAAWLRGQVVTADGGLGLRP